MTKGLEVEPVPPRSEAEDTPELRVADIMNYGVLITRDGKRVDPQDLYVQRPPAPEGHVWSDEVGARRC